MLWPNFYTKTDLFIDFIKIEKCINRISLLIHRKKTKVNSTQEDVISAAKIYGKSSSDKVLTPDQISVVEAADKLTLENLSLFCQRGVL